MVKRAIFLTLDGDPHTQGIFKAARIAREAGYDVHNPVLGMSRNETLQAVQEYNPTHIGLSYRLSPEKGLDNFLSLMNLLDENGLLVRQDGEKRKLAFAGLHPTVDMVTNSDIGRTNNVFGIKQNKDPLESVNTVLDYLGIPNSSRQEILERSKARLIPPRIEVLDQLADRVIEDDIIEPPLEKPSMKGVNSYVNRVKEVWPERPFLRVHYGEPGDTIEPTIHGIRTLALAGAVDEISIGSDDWSQRYFNRPEKLRDGNIGAAGVPYRNWDDLLSLLQSARPKSGEGNLPSIKPYAHVVDIEDFLLGCIERGIIGPSHYTVPLFWFNVLDNRGPAYVKDSLREHLKAVKIAAGHKIPVEMNDPNHWQSRWAPDSTVVADYGLIGSVMLDNGVKDMVLQIQTNKPRETSDFGDLAKFSAAIEIIEKLTPYDLKGKIRVWRQPRTGIGYFEPDIDVARWQLARSTILQSIFDPQMIHIVPPCEALYAAKPNDIITGSNLVRKAYRLARENFDDLKQYLENSTVVERKDYLVNEALFLLGRIAELNLSYPIGGCRDDELHKYLSDPTTLHKSLEYGYMAAPGIFTEPYRKMAGDNIYTDVVPGGFIDLIDPVTLNAITQEQRFNYLD